MAALGSSGVWQTPISKAPSIVPPAAPAKGLTLFGAGQGGVLLVAATPAAWTAFACRNAGLAARSGRALHVTGRRPPGPRTPDDGEEQRQHDDRGGRQQARVRGQGQGQDVLALACVVRWAATFAAEADAEGGQLGHPELHGTETGEQQRGGDDESEGRAPQADGGQQCGDGGQA